MYSSSGRGALGPEFTNNPFINDPSNPHTRFPDISANSPTPLSPGVGQYTTWPQPPPGGSGYQLQAQPQMAYQYSTQPSQDASVNMDTPPSYFDIHPPIQSQFQPSSAFGQQLVSPTISGSGYGYLQGQNSAYTGSSGSSSLNAAQQQIQNNPGYIAQFDPYASIGQGWDGQIQPQTQNQGQGPNSFSIAPQNSSGPHPRDYIRAHKAELEVWDPYAWKQLMNTFDTLKGAWDVRKTELDGKVAQLQNQMQYGGGAYFYPGQMQQEQGRLQELLKQSIANIDSVVASSFQMREVHSGYRQSGDMASKRRVRESCNAALQSLPDWPQPY